MSGPVIGRRRASAALACIALVAACKSEPRCRNCGMKLDPKSAWRTELAGAEGEAFDTPRCAFAAWRAGKVRATGVVAIEYYDRVKLPGSGLRFVVGSDVLGPMGPDFVPVSPDHVTKFLKDHGGHAVAQDDVTPALLDDPK